MINPDKHVLIVVDMQNGFCTGSLGNPRAVEIVPAVAAKIDEYHKHGGIVIFTRDTHYANYMDTQEGRKLPVPHCIHGTPDWCIVDELFDPKCVCIDKPTFGFLNWIDYLPEDIESIEICGTVTEICVVSNAMILKASFPEAEIYVDALACAGLTYKSHLAALNTMEACQINIMNKDIMEGNDD